jgi:hypothetical protein
MAALADAKRHRYRDHAAPFQRPATNARDVHAAFLSKLLDWDGFDVLVHGDVGAVDGFLVSRRGSAPPPFGEGSLFHVNDFAVEDEKWGEIGRPLLAGAVAAAAAAGIETAIVVSGPETIDPAKTAFLSGQGFAVEAEWWVKPIACTDGAAPPPKQGFDAAVGSAPPVYDPGGPTSLALRIDEPAAVERFEKFAAASGAVVAIVPVHRSDDEIRATLAASGYTIASEWYVATVDSFVG